MVTSLWQRGELLNNVEAGGRHLVAVAHLQAVAVHRTEGEQLVLGSFLTMLGDGDGAAAGGCRPLRSTSLSDTWLLMLVPKTSSGILW